MGTSHWIQKCVPLVGSIALAACTGSFPWPAPAYSSAAAPLPVERCPDVAGIYLNRTSGSATCIGVDSLACESLGFYLLSEHVPEAKKTSNYPTSTDDWPFEIRLVALEQPSIDVIRILVGDTRDNLRLARELRADADDFHCQSETIHLRPRLQSDFLAAGLYIWRRHNRDDRSLHRTLGGDLAVTSSRTYSSYFLGFMGGTASAESDTITWPLARKP